MKDLYDILLLKTLVKNTGTGGITNEQIQNIMNRLEEKLEIYLTESIENLPTITEEELLEILI